MTARPLTFAILPDGVSDEGIALHRREALYGYLSKPLIKDLSSYLDGKKVLEVYAGRGHLAALLSEQGIDVKATSLRQGHDASYELGHVYCVEDMDSVTAVKTYGGWADVILTCWPTTDPGLLRSLPFILDTQTIVFIGEVTDYFAKPFPLLGGCATDEFFESVVEIADSDGIIRYPTPRIDKIKIYRKK